MAYRPNLVQHPFLWIKLGYGHIHSFVDFLQRLSTVGRTELWLQSLTAHKANCTVSKLSKIPPTYITRAFMGSSYTYQVNILQYSSSFMSLPAHLCVTWTLSARYLQFPSPAYSSPAPSPQCSHSCWQISLQQPSLNPLRLLRCPSSGLQEYSFYPLSHCIKIVCLLMWSPLKEQVHEVKNGGLCVVEGSLLSTVSDT